MPTPELNPKQIRQLVRAVLRSESESVALLANKLPVECVDVVSSLFQCKGRVIVTGMGKMSAIGRKFTATLSSLGTPAIFLHPVEAMHGDLGIVTCNDILMALSNSGETSEILELIPFLKRQHVPVFSITGTEENSLAEISDLNIATGVTNEADDVTEAPTNSTTTTLALCDALAIALVHLNGFTAEQFAANHPGGKIGRKLLLRVNDLMVTGKELPVVSDTAHLREAIVTISRGKMGAGLIVDSAGRLKGILTDGDLRRVLERDPDPLDRDVSSMMTTTPKTLSANLLAVEALTRMNDHAITVMPVIQQDGIVIGALHLHELLKAGLG